jgi:hypothetical protein
MHARRIQARIATSIPFRSGAAEVSHGGDAAKAGYGSDAVEARCSGDPGKHGGNGCCATLRAVLTANYKRLRRRPG